MSGISVIVWYAIVAVLFGLYAGWSEVNDSATIILFTVLWPVAMFVMLGWAIRDGRGK